MSQFFAVEGSSLPGIEALAGDSGTALPVNLPPETITIAGGVGITTIASGSTVTINGTGGSMDYIDQTTTPVTMVVDTGYAADNAGLVTLTLPATSALGSVLEIDYKGAGGWAIAQGAGQQIRFGTATTTLGAGGSLSSSAAGDSVTLRCITANVLWIVTAAIGNPTVV